jgi:hypothetical protein
MKACLHQMFRSTMVVSRPGVGDCTKCVADEKNHDCLQYVPIHISTFEVKDGNSDQQEM